MSSYNYTQVREYKQKIAIPYTSIEFEGYISLVSFIVILGTLTFILGSILSLIIENGYLIAFGISVILAFIALQFINEVNNKTGRNRLQQFYYQRIKNYRMIYDGAGDRHFLSKKRKGVYAVCMSRK